MTGEVAWFGPTLVLIGLGGIALLNWWMARIGKDYRTVSRGVWCAGREAPASMLLVWDRALERYIGVRSCSLEHGEPHCSMTCLDTLNAQGRKPLAVVG